MIPFFTSPPPARTFADDKATLIVCWWCTMFAATIIVFRVAGRYIRTEKLFPEDIIAFLCIVPIMARMAFVHVVLLWGTNNVVTDGLSQTSISHREIGSRLVLGSRIFYAASLWMLKLSIAEFLKRLTRNIWRPTHELVLRVMYYYLGATMVAVVIADLAECRPVTNYWQVVPDPGPQCRQGYAQLITMAVANVTTDLLLIVFPIPLILGSHMPLTRKTQLTLLFGLSVIPIGITLCRVPTILRHSGAQHYRSLWASIEILFATAVANALVIGSFVRDRGVKKHKFKLGSSGSMERTLSSRRGPGIAFRQWGSDEELVRGLGIGVDPDLQHDTGTSRPRPAPVAEPDGGIDRSWRFPNRKGSESDVDAESAIDYPLHQPPTHSTDSDTPRKANFFDVGNLLGPDSPPAATLRDSAASQGPLIPRQSSSNTRPSRRGSTTGVAAGRRGSVRRRSASPFDSFPAPIAAPLDASANTGGASVFLQDVGGLLSSTPPPPKTPPASMVRSRSAKGVRPVHKDGASSTERSPEKGPSLSEPAAMLRQWSKRATGRRDKNSAGGSPVEMQSLNRRTPTPVGVQVRTGEGAGSPVGKGPQRSGMELNDVGGLLG